MSGSGVLKGLTISEELKTVWDKIFSDDDPTTWVYCEYDASGEFCAPLNPTRAVYTRFHSSTVKMIDVKSNLRADFHHALHSRASVLAHGCCRSIFRQFDLGMSLRVFCTEK